MNYHTKHLNNLKFYYLRQKLDINFLLKQKHIRLQATHNKGPHTKFQVCTKKIVAYRACTDGVTDGQNREKMNELLSRIQWSAVMSPVKLNTSSLMINVIRYALYQAL